MNNPAKSESSLADTVWPWRANAPDQQQTTARKRRQRAIIQGAITATLATLLLTVWHKQWLGLIVFILSGVIITAGFLAPRIFQALEKFGQWLGHAVGVGITWLLLTPFFYICFTAGRLLLLAMRKDPLQRGFERSRKSYWVDRRSVATPQYYTRQY